MISMKYFFTKIRDVKFRDFMSLIPMLFAWFLAPFFRSKYKNTWLITEEPKEARDNGYWFFKKTRENHPEQKCIYAIDKKSVDYENVKDLGMVIQYGSFQHWIVYFTCQYNISSQKGGKPNAALCAFIELNNLHNAHNIFLQHGVIINNLKWLYSDCSRFDMFVTSAVPEKEFIEQNFGYSRGIVKLTGLPRFDNLHQSKTNSKRIVIMPTWRYWFNLKSKQKKGFDNDFKSSEYLAKWKEFLECDKLQNLITEHNLEVVFYPHRNLQNHLSEIKKLVKTKAIIASWEDYDIQELLITSAMMITDYSSVFFDMIYMKKPVLFYQFDFEKFRTGQYEQGYFDYRNNPFANAYEDIDELLKELEMIINSGYKVSDLFMKEHSIYFPLYDDKNSERIYQELKEMENG